MDKAKSWKRKAKRGALSSPLWTYTLDQLTSRIGAGTERFKTLSDSSLHLYPLKEQRKHCFNGGANCVCEPEVEVHGVDEDGKAIRIFTHQDLRVRMKERRKKKC